jgi:hypothetical protein
MSRIQVKIYDGTGRRVHIAEAETICCPIQALKEAADQFVEVIAAIPPREETV